MTIKRGESIFLDFIYSDGTIPDGYTASFFIDGTDIKGNLDLNKDKTAFLLRIKSNQTEIVGVFKLVIFVENEAIGYKEYIFDEKLIIEEI